MASQIDYIFFCYGLGFILLAVICRSLKKSKQYSLPWEWLGLFGLIHGSHEFLDLLALSLGDWEPFKAFRTVLMAASFICLFEFGRRGSEHINEKRISRWVTLSFVAISFLSAPYGWTALNAGFRYTLGLCGGLWTASIFIQLSRRLSRRNDKLKLHLLAIVFALYAISTGIITPKSSFLLASLLNNDSFLGLFGFPVQLVRGLCALASAAIIWQVFLSRRDRIHRAEHTIFILSAVLILAIGWMYADRIGKATEREMEESIKSLCAVSAAALEHSEIVGIDSPNWSARDAHYRALKQRLMDMRSSSPQYRFIYVMTLRGNKVVFAADSEPPTSKDCSAPGDIYTDAPKEVFEVFSGNPQNARGAYQDRWGRWYSAFVAIKDSKSNKTQAVLGIDYPQELFKRTVARERLEPILMTLLAVLALIAYYVAYERQKDSVDSIAATAQSLKEKEEHLSCTLQSIGDAVIVTDCDGVVLRMNAVAEELTGWESKDGIGRHVTKVLNIIDAETRGPAINPIEKVLDSGESAEIAKGTLIVSKNGVERQIADSCSPVRDFDGSVIGAVLVFRDITEEYDLLRELQESEERFRTITSSAQDAVIMLDDNGMISFWNTAAEKIFGYSAEEIVGNSCHSILAPQRYRDIAKMAFPEFRSTGSGAAVGKNIELAALKKDGTEFPIELSLSAVQVDGHWRAIGILRDISERKRFENEIIAKSEELERYFSLSLDMLCIADTEGRLLRLNPQWEKTIGYPINELEGKLFLDFVHPDDIESTLAIMSALNAQEEVMSFENRYLCADGSYRWIEWRSRPQGNIVYAAARDITKRKNAEEILRARTEQLDLITSNVPGVVYQFYARPGRDYGLHYVSERAKDILGLDNDTDTFFSEFTACAPADERDRLIESVDKAVEAKSSWEYSGKFIKPDGEEIYIHGISSCSSVDDELIFTGVILDITDQRRAEDELIEANTLLEVTLAQAKEMAKQATMAREELQNEKDNLAAIFASSPVGMLLLDEDTTIVDANDVIGEMVSRSTNEIIYQRGGGGLGCVHSKEHEKGCGYSVSCLFCSLRTAITQVLSEGTYVKGAEFQATLEIDGKVISPWLRVSAQPVSINNRKHVVVAVDNITEQKKAEEALITSESLHKSMTSNIRDVIAIVGEDGLVKYKSPNIEKWFGWWPDELVGGSAFVTAHPDDLDLLQNAFFRLIEKPDSAVTIEYRYKCKDNTYKLIELTAFNLISDPIVNGILANYHDITERKTAETQVRLHSAAINAAEDMIAILDGDGFIVFANDSFRRQVGCSEEELVGEDLSILWPQPRNRQNEKEVWAAIENGNTWSGEMPCKSHDGSSYTADVTIAPIADEEGRQTHLILIARNITERKKYEGLLDYKAHHDVLTDLPNRLLFSKELAWAISEHGDKGKKLAVLFIDLDKFKMVNDTMGHQAGDTLLIETAARLRDCLREGDILARMGGDEFTVILKQIETLDDVSVIAQRMLEQVWIPYEIDGSKLVIGASIGVSIFPDNAPVVEDLLKFADAAMYKAKELGRNNYQFFSDDLSQANDARLEMETDLRLAIERDEIKIYYQPIMDVRTMQISGAEALLRWEHPEKGVISPSLFVPVAEETGLIIQLGRKALAEACYQCKQWQEQGYDNFEVSVNVSPVQLNDISFVSEIEALLAETGLSRDSLKIEVTEGVLARNDYDEVDILAILRSLGIKICLDDFGVGYSSLSRLKNLPIVHMKIDGCFISDIEHNAKDRAMTESIILMAHNLGISVTAEWIEDAGQLQVIKSLGCDYAQGYLVSPALSASDLQRFLQDWESSRLRDNAA